VRAIADYARQVAADLVVVSNRPRRRNGYWFAGSFAAALGKAVTSPTIVVPDTVPHPVSMGWPFRNIVAGVDFSDASFRALSESLNLAQRGAGRLRIVHVMRGFPFETVYGGSAAWRLRARLGATATRINRELRHLIPSDARNWSEITTTTVAGDAPEGILASASRARADLIVLGLPRRSRLEEFLAGSTVHRVVRRATVPILLVPGPATPPSFLLAEERALRPAPSMFGERGLEGKEVATAWR
jgi:nucleotide-binding universal stress UspA family protein